MVHTLNTYSTCYTLGIIFERGRLLCECPLTKIVSSFCKLLYKFSGLFQTPCIYSLVSLTYWDSVVSEGYRKKWNTNYLYHQIQISLEGNVQDKRKCRRYRAHHSTVVSFTLLWNLKLNRFPRFLISLTNILNSLSDFRQLRQSIVLYAVKSISHFFKIQRFWTYCVAFRVCLAPRFYKCRITQS